VLRTPLQLGDDVFPPGIVHHARELEAPSEEGLEAFTGLVLPARLGSAVLERRAHYLAGRFCARVALTEIDAAFASFEVESGEQREPLWPEHVVGSITHTRGFAAAAVGRRDAYRGIGIDVERGMKPEAPGTIGRRVAFGDELERATEASGWPAHEALTLLFSAKESVYKALFPTVGRYFGFAEARVTVEPGARGLGFRARLTSTLAPDLPEGLTLAGRVRRFDLGLLTALAWGSQDLEQLSRS
jgi:enterobactin synthetase component D